MGTTASLPRDRALEELDPYQVMLRRWPDGETDELRDEP